MTVGHEGEQTAIITSGLKEGERVVTDGASRLSDGSKVRMPEPTANKVPEPMANATTEPAVTAAPGAAQRRSRPKEN